MSQTKYIKIESSSNKMFKEFLSIKNGERKNDGLILIEGEDLVEEAKRASKLLYVLTYDYEYALDSYINYILPKKLIERLSSFKSISHVLGIAKLNINNYFGEKVIYLDCVQDPGNVGTIIRTALALNYKSIALSLDSASFANSKTIQASKGSIFNMNLGYASLDFFKENRYNIYLTTLDGKNIDNIDNLKKPYVLVFGNEGKGIKEEHKNYGEKLKIEINSFDSLNVAIAAGIFMYKFKD